MSEKKIKDSIDNIEPASGAKERMYRNIMKKAAQAAPEEKPAEPKRNSAGILRYILPVAACFCLLVIGIARFLPGITPAGPGESTVLGGSPFVEVKNAEAFKALSITLDAPEGAQNTSYAIIDDKIAEVDFELDGKNYLARASAQDGDFSGLNGQEFSEETIDAETNAILVSVNTGTGNYQKIIWTDGRINYCLYGTDGANREQIISVYQALKK